MSFEKPEINLTVGSIDGHPLYVKIPFLTSFLSLGISSDISLFRCAFLSAYLDHEKETCPNLRAGTLHQFFNVKSIIFSKLPLLSFCSLKCQNFECILQLPKSSVLSTFYACVSRMFSILFPFFIGFVFYDTCLMSFSF